ncbi:helix-turn-helix transcriptional regulator [Paenibacillus cisolokensis]|uniref:helix-turn-helix domain-containing protein n=1 Tax=Paenibacillus cisolokensis TaxID=1658519 RepID=UPI003D2B1DD2
MDLISNIKEQMNLKGMTQYKLAKNSGVPHSTMSALLKGGIKNPSVELISKIADALEVSVSTLLGEGDEGTTETDINNKLFSALKLLVDDEGFFYEEFHEDIFRAVISSINYAYLSQHTSNINKTITRFAEFFRSDEEYLESELYELKNEFNKLFNYKSLKDAILSTVEVHRKEELLLKLSEILYKHKITLPSHDEMKECDQNKPIELEDLINGDLTFRGRVLTDEEKERFLKLARAFFE